MCGPGVRGTVSEMRSQSCLERKDAMTDDCSDPLRREHVAPDLSCFVEKGEDARRQRAPRQNSTKVVQSPHGTRRPYKHWASKLAEGDVVCHCDAEPFASVPSPTMSELKSGQSPAFRQRWKEHGRTWPMTVGLSSAFLLVCAMGGIRFLKSAHIKAAMSQPARMPTLNTVGEPAPVHASVPRKAELVFIPAGTVRIGDEDGPPSERPSFQYKSRPFLMDRTPVTVAQFAAFVKDTGYKTDAERYGPGGVLDEKQGAWVAVPGADWRGPQGPRSQPRRWTIPVTQVSWYDASHILQCLRHAASHRV